MLDGCCIIDCDPVYHCSKCKKDFGAPIAELEAEAISFYFSIGGFSGDNHMIIIIKMDDGAAVNYSSGTDICLKNPLPKRNSVLKNGELSSIESFIVIFLIGRNDMLTRM